MELFLQIVSHFWNIGLSVHLQVFSIQKGFTAICGEREMPQTISRWSVLSGGRMFMADTYPRSS